jgi:hypothetical protein
MNKTTIILAAASALAIAACPSDVTMAPGVTAVAIRGGAASSTRVIELLLGSAI